jgi:hypothetical protein
VDVALRADEALLELELAGGALEEDRRRALHLARVADGRVDPELELVGADTST